MITANYIRTLYDYNYWATARLLRAAQALSDEQFTATPLPGQGSLQQILTHIVSAEWMWRSRWEGVSPRALLATADFPTLAQLQAYWHTEEQAMRTRLSQLEDADLMRDVAYTTTSGKSYATPLWQILVHLVNHSTQHRSDAALLLTIMGHSPGDLDMIFFFREKL